MIANIPTALSSIIPWALVLAADMAAGLTLEPKNLRRNEMLGNSCCVKVKLQMEAFLQSDMKLFMMG